MTAQCQCGCGGEVALAKRNNPRFGHVKGQPVRYIPGHHRRGASPPLEDRFWAGVDVRGSDECWVWTKGRLPGGYGALWHGDNNRGTHRIAWELANGPIPDGLWVLHRCDNRPCCNPGHLFLGTQADNDADRTTKGRSHRGEQHRCAKLTEEAVRDLRRRFAAGEPIRNLARQYGVSDTSAWYAATGRTWKHVV